jgi:predicted regulator of Ras-like GTPase activity (Roadblock/LC7/MglB family)
VLATLLEDRRVVAATLVDLDSGFILDACTREGDLGDLDLLGAGHADLMRAAPAITGEKPGAASALTVETADGRVHLLRDIPDPHGDRLVLAVVVAGSPRSVARARQRLVSVPIEALTAGPGLQRRPVDGRWLIGPTQPDAPAMTPEGLPGLEPVIPTVPSTPTGGVATEPGGLFEPVVGVGDGPAPPPAMVPVVVTAAPDPTRWAGTGAPTEPELGADAEFGPDPEDEPEPGEVDGAVRGLPSPRQEPAGVET